MKIKRDHLPARKLSTLLRIARRDLRKVEKMPKKYEVNMMDWHAPISGVCSVCLAGAALACTIGVPRTINWCDRDDVDLCGIEDTLLERQTSAINSLRCGLIYWAFVRLFGQDAVFPRGVKQHLKVADYVFDRRQFHADLRKLEAYLKSKGL